MSDPTCSAVLAELTAYVDGEQPEPERERIAAHLTSCLACRREHQRVIAVSSLVAGLPRVEPSPGFDEHMWRRLDAARGGVTSRRGWRGRGFAFAAAAVVILAFATLLSRSDLRATLGARGADRVAAHGAGGGGRAALARGEREPGSGAGRDARVAAAGHAGPEELPPELIEHPELFLRYPVVRRLNKLEHFEEVRQRLGDEPVGGLAPSGRSVG